MGQLLKWRYGSLTFKIAMSNSIEKVNFYEGRKTEKSRGKILEAQEKSNKKLRSRPHYAG